MSVDAPSLPAELERLHRLYTLVFGDFQGLAIAPTLALGQPLSDLGQIVVALEALPHRRQSALALVPHCQRAGAVSIHRISGGVSISLHRPGARPEEPARTIGGGRVDPADWHRLAGELEQTAAQIGGRAFGPSDATSLGVTWRHEHSGSGGRSDPALATELLALACADRRFARGHGLNHLEIEGLRADRLAPEVHRLSFCPRLSAPRLADALSEWGPRPVGFGRFNEDLLFIGPTDEDDPVPAPVRARLLGAGAVDPEDSQDPNAYWELPRRSQQLRPVRTAGLAEALGRGRAAGAAG